MVVKHRPGETDVTSFATKKKQRGQTERSLMIAPLSRPKRGRKDRVVGGGGGHAGA